MNKLVLFTNRSGSTLLCDILAYASGNINLGEGLHSVTRDYNFNTKENKQTDLYKEFAGTNISSLHVTTRNRGSDFIEFGKARGERIQRLKTCNDKWIAKYNVELVVFDKTFIEYCVNSNVKLYMTHRENIVDHFVSRMNAWYRYEIIKHKNEGFIYTNNTPFDTYDSIIVKFDWLQQCMITFIQQLLLWRTIYEMYKENIELVSYENVIKPMSFESIGINSNVIQSYKQEMQHLVPTPYNTTNVIVVDDHPKPIVGCWDQTIYFLNQHKYLVEI